MIDIIKAQNYTNTQTTDDFEVGQLYKVIQGDEPKMDALWLRTGDVVKIIGVYPYVVLVEKVKGYHLRQCFIRRCWRQYLRRVK